jgi:transcriptional antiterminator RfaH
VLVSVNSHRWYVAQCKPREDARALENLERQGFTCYRPTLKVEKLRQGRRFGVLEALFPGYLFIKLDETHDNWHSIRSTRGVMQLVRFNEYPVPVRDEIIEGIRRRLCVERPFVPYLRPGERVRVTAGPFAPVEAIFLAYDGEARVVLLMNILHQEQRLIFPMASVRKARVVP